MFKKPSLKNIAILASILGPFLLLGGILASVYVPYIDAKPLTTDFVYSTSEYCAEYTYKLVNDSIQLTTPTERCKDEPLPNFYYFDAKANSSKILSQDEIQKLRINTNSRSPDGFEIIKRDTSSRGVFWSSSENKIVAKKNSTFFDISIHSNTSVYYFKFIGWVK